MWNPAKEAEKKAKSAIDKILKPAAEKLRKASEEAIWKLRRETWDRIEKKGKSVIDDIEDAGKDVKGEIEKIPALAEKEVKNAFQALAQAVTKEGLKTVKEVVSTADKELGKLAKSKPELVDAINGLGGSIEIGPMTLKYSGFYTRTAQVADVLDQYINNPPELRRGPILEMVEALGPTSVDMGISIQVMAVVVGSRELGVGGGLDDISIELFTEIGDVILEKLGVPE